MRVIAVTNQKGGSGKTTTTVNLGACLAEQGRKVLVIDLDPQGNATYWLGAEEVGNGIYGVFTANGNLLDVITPTNTEGIDIVPSHPDLVSTDMDLAGKIGADFRLREQISLLPAGKWDYILLDCPPALGKLTVNALTAAKEVLVPVEAHVMALAGFVQLTETIEQVRQYLNPDLVIGGILACRVNRTRHAQDVVQELKGRYGNVVYNGVIRENVRIAEAPSFGQPITTYDPTSNGAADYRAMAQEVIAQEGR